MFFRDLLHTAKSRSSLYAGVLCLAAGSMQLSAGAQKAAVEHLVWSDEFSKPGPVPDAANWSFETGGGGWGNHELETYCSPQTTQAPCKPADKPNSFIGADGMLHLVARRDPATGAWTSARLASKGLQSFQYGRIEARIRIPGAAGVWPAFWMLGANIDARPWPACGELDIMENVGKLPAQINGSVHGTGFTGTPLTTIYKLPSGEPFAAHFHTYGLLWSPGKIAYYVDDPAHPYATYTRESLPVNAVWPFDDGRYFLLLNLAMGGDWPGPPSASTPAVEEMLVDYVRVYQTGPKGGPGQ